MNVNEPPLRKSLTFIVLISALGCNDNLPGKPDLADRPKAPSEVLEFAALFGRNCSGCHGVDGKLGPAPPLNDPILLAIVPDELLVEVISNGRTGTPMPAFARRHSGGLTDEQIKTIATGLKTHWQSRETQASDLPPYLIADNGFAVDPGAIKRGEQLFAQACALCHGENGAGTGDGKSPGRINDPELLSLFSDQVLRRIIITGRADLGMPSFSGSDGRDSNFRPLTSDQINDLVSLLHHWRTLSTNLAGAGHSPR